MSALRDRLAPERAALADAIRALSAADARLRDADDAGEQRALVPLCELAEALGDAAAAVSKAARALLQESMEEDGVMSFEAGAWTAALREQPGTVEVLDPAAIPAEFMAPQPRKLDRAALERALRHAPVPGAALTKPNRRTLTIRRKA